MTVKQAAQEKPVEEKVEENKQQPVNWALILSWASTFLLVGILLLVLFHINPFDSRNSAVEPLQTSEPTEFPLPGFDSGSVKFSVARSVQLDTTIPDGIRQFPVMYTVESGDSIFAIGKKFGLKPESILWANYDLLNDDPTYLKVGWKLTIPPTDGIFYKWVQGDSLDKVAEKYHSTATDIISWPSNKLDITNPVTTGLEYVMIPNGWRELQSWIVPVAFAPRSGASRVIAGPGGCETSASGPVGSTAFSWPVYNRYLSGFGFESYHLAIDIGALEGTPVYAADSGVVIYAGWNDTGYGNLIVIDHLNGYETVYAHLSQIYVSCGQGVYNGATIGAAGNTGKSTGSHLHFEVRLNGGFVNPWSVLP